jgi:hypothetical protein
MFATNGASPLTAAEVHAVQTAYELGINQNPYQTVNGGALPYPFNGSAFSAAETVLYNFYAMGVQEYTLPGYVLRSVRNVSKRSTVAASYANVNTVQPPPNVANVNTLIGSLPTGEWLLKAPQVRQYGARRWQITQEWWWSPKWSALLYGGTGTP